MKSFQDWLDCQLYSSHLKNLTKIKEDALCMKASNTNRRLLKTATGFKNISYLDSIQHRSDLRHNRMNSKTQMKEIQIMQQNLNLASRLLNVSSVISKDKQVESYRKYQSLFKKNTNNKRFDSLRAKKLKKFMKVSEQNYLMGVHKSIIKIKFDSIPKVPEGQSPTFWLQIYSGTQKVSSSHYSLQSIICSQIKLPLKRKPDRHLVLLLHCSRGLDYLNLGEYYVEAPKKGLKREYKNLTSHQDSRKQISLSVDVEDLGLHTKHKSFHLR